MLRITTMAPAEAALLLEGRLTETDVALLEEEVGRQRGAGLMLDLRGLSSIDRAGLALLQRLAGAGVTWRNARPYVQLLLERRGLA